MKNMTQRCLLLLLLAVSSIAGTSAKSAEHSRTDSIFNCAYAKCEDSPDSYDFYIASSPVNDPVINGKKESGDFWLVFVDQMPEANWEHPCRYIYVSDKKVSDTYETLVVDSTLPPHTVTLVPCRLSQASKERLNVSPSVQAYALNKEPELKTYTTPFSSHTYAIILSGGLSPVENVDRYWNDCSYIYKTLTRNFGVPKGNVKVLMSDGRSHGLDRNRNSSLSPDLDSSPLDLDGDGEPDIDYSASKDTLAMVFAELKGKLTDNDHLLVFVTDHGGKDDNSGESYINLWNGNRLYPDELAGYVKDLNAGYVSFVLGQCYSGGFIPALTANNHIVLTACGENELSFCCRKKDLKYNEFLYNWISALNRTDIYGNTLSVSDTSYTGKLIPVSLKRAFDYAVKKDAYNKGRTLRLIENPQISILSGSTAEDLALDSIPPTVYLYIGGRKRSTPVSFKTSSGKSSIVGDLEALNFWNSSDVWLRNQDDGIEHQVTENPNISSTKRDFYVYTKVRNRGVKPYTGNGWSLSTWWAESSMVISRDVWEGKCTNTKSMVGKNVDDESIEDRIEPGDSLVIGYYGVISKKDFDKMNPGDKHICLLSNVYKDDEMSDIYSNDDDYVLSVWNTDRLAQCNRVDLTAKFTGEKSFDINLFNFAKGISSYVLALHTINTEEPVTSRVRMKMGMSSGLMDSWKGNGANGIDVKLDVVADNSILLNSDSAVVADLQIAPRKKEKISFRFNRLANKAVTAKCDEQLDVAVFDAATGRCLGGETFVIPLTPRAAMNPEITKTLNSDGTYTLTATNVNEDVSYEWHDKDGRVIGTGKTITVPANSSNVEYSLEVKAVSDAAISNATMAVERIPMISDVHATPEGAAVSFSAPVRNGTTARIVFATDASNCYDYNIESNVKNCMLPIPKSSRGVYQIMLIEGGKVIETRKFVK